MRSITAPGSLVACCIAAGLTVLTCSNPVDKRVNKPQLSIVSDTVVSVKDSVALHALGTAGSAKAVNFVWTLDSHRINAAATPDSICRLFFGIPDTGEHIVTVTGLGQGNAESEPETTKVLVLLNPPVVHFVTKDTTISANDTVHVFATGSDPNGSVTAYRWQIDTNSVPVFSTGGTLSCWFGDQSAIHCIRVSAMDDDSIVSQTESVHIRVAVYPSHISVLHDTVIAINDTLVINAVRLDTFSTALHWIWAVHGTAFSDTTNVPLCRARFARTEAGDRRVFVKAIDNHRIESNVDSMHVLVVMDPPRVSIVHDTIVPINDPAVLHAHGSDTNGFIARYVWAMDGVHFADTTGGDSIVHVYSRIDTGRSIVVLVKAFDDDTLESNTDSVHIVVRLKPSPFVAVTRDTSVFINDSFTIAAQGTESGSKSPITWFLWAVDRAQFDDTSKTGLKILSFGRLGVGRHVVRVKAVDRDTMESLADSLVVQVRLGAPTVAGMKDTAVFINDTVLVHASGTDTNGSVVRYVWAADGGPFTDTTTAGTTKKVWARQETGMHVIRVIALDDDTVASAPAPCTVTVRLGTPVVAGMKDTAVFINDTALVHASGTDTNGSVMWYAWSTDGGPFTDTTIAGTIRKVWAKPGAGVHIIRVVAIDNDTLSSTPVPCTVTVRLGMPVVVAMNDTAVFINDTVVVHASGTDTNGSVMRYAWAIDNGTFTDTTAVGLIKKVWAKSGAGVHVVRVIAIDNDSISSRQDSAVVTVRLGTPVLKAVHDTAATWGTTLAVVVTATDTNGTIQQYFEDSSGTGVWTDSSAHDTLRFSSSMHGRKMAIVGVRDDDGLVARDTFFIDYKAVRCTVSAQGPKAGDTVYCLTKNRRQAAAPLSFSARRLDAVKDTFSYTLWSGPSPSALVQSYHGSDTACTLKTLDTGTYYWKIVAVDTHNDTTTTPVSSVYGLFQRRICFIGHSIISGLGCNAGRGGMRRTVIDTLRATAGFGKNLWCEGPLNSSFLLPAQDDSCLAVGGKTSSDIYDSLRIYSATNADIWVYMNGANEGYRFPTADPKYGSQNYQLVTIDSMHARNPQGEIYVFNGLPFPPAVDACFTQNLDTIYTVHLPIFNQMLDTAITHRRTTWQGKSEAGIWIVNANTPLSLPSGFYNPAYFMDCQHPNQAGYDIMARELFKAMRAAKSSFIK